MYKDENMMSREVCNEALLRMVIDGKGNRASSGTDNEGCRDRSRCIDETWGLASHPLASVYAPMQKFENLYDLDMALREGTIFSELNLPFMGRRIEKGGKCCG